MIGGQSSSRKETKRKDISPRTTLALFVPLPTSSFSSHPFSFFQKPAWLLLPPKRSWDSSSAVSSSICSLSRECYTLNKERSIEESSPSSSLPSPGFRCLSSLVRLRFLPDFQFSQKLTKMALFDMAGIVEWYHAREATGSSDSNLLSWSLTSLHRLRSTVASHTLASPHQHVKKWDVVVSRLASIPLLLLRD